MKKYAKLKCSECARTIDQIVNLSHFVPNRCNITLGCEGLLSIEGYTNNGNTIRGTPSDNDVSNWAPRGSRIISAIESTESPLINLSTGTLQQIILAVKNQDTIIDDISSVNLTFVVEDDTPKDYRKYTFRKSVPTKIINGVEDGVEKKTLRYSLVGSDPDVISVFVNGIQVDEGTGAGQYQLYSGDSSSQVPPNAILFNNTIAGTSIQVDVVISKSRPTSTLQLPFSRMISDNSRVGTGSWEGVNYVTIIDSSAQKWYLFYCDLSEQALLPLNSKLRISTDFPPMLSDGSSKDLNLEECAFLLSVDGVFTYLDQIKSKYIPLSGLNSDTKYLTIKLVDGVKHLYATEISVKDIFPVMVTTNYYARTALMSNLTGNSEAVKLDNQIILGPDS